MVEHKGDKAAGDSGGSAGVEPRGERSTPAKPKRSKRRTYTVRAGGHVTEVDLPPATPERKPLCSVHGQNCPGHDSGSGWHVDEGD